MIFRIQKNRHNGQSTTLKSDDTHPEICPVQAPYQILIRSKRFGHSDTQLMAVFIYPHGIKKCLIGNIISEHLQLVAKAAHPDMNKNEISCFSSHSGRFWALVLLDKAGMSPEFLCFRLHWLGESYRLYICDTSVIQTKYKIP
jgi:hypothetical protein